MMGARLLISCLLNAAATGNMTEITAGLSHRLVKVDGTEFPPGFGEDRAESSSDRGGTKGVRESSPALCRFATLRSSIFYASCICHTGRYFLPLKRRLY